MSEINLKGRIALVTGSARRVGRAIALELARQGMHQIIHYRDSEDEARICVEEARALGVETSLVQADVSQPADINRLFDTIHQQYGRLDLLVNSASIFGEGNILDVSLDA